MSFLSSHFSHVLWIMVDPVVIDTLESLSALKKLRVSGVLIPLPYDEESSDT